MSTLQYTTAQTDGDLAWIAALEAAKLVSAVSAATQASQGFVTESCRP